MIYKNFDLSSLTPNQQSIIKDALDRVDFPFERLQEKLLSTKGKLYIPVEFADLSRYAGRAHRQVQRRAEELESLDPFRLHDEHDHDYEPSHFHVEENGDVGHGIFRERVLGLAWYSGRVSIDSSLESNPEYAIEVFLAEGAHMIDFFYMTNEHRTAIYKVYHPGISDAEIQAHLPQHGWFEEQGDQDYWDWVGESFMAGFIRAYARPGSVQVSLDSFTHRSTPEVGPPIRSALTPDLPKEPFEPTEEEPEGETFFRSSKRSKTYHLVDSSHGRRYAQVATFDTAQEAEEAGLRACKVCF